MPDRWDVIDIDFGQPMGREPAKLRPALIVSYDDLNHNTPYVAACPITSTVRRLYGCEVPLPAGEAVPKNSIIQVQLVRTVDSSRLREWRGRLHDPAIQRQVEQALMTLFGLDSAL